MESLSLVKWQNLCHLSLSGRRKSFPNKIRKSQLQHQQRNILEKKKQKFNVLLIFCLYYTIKQSIPEINLEI